jgi:hypothetical protein
MSTTGVPSIASSGPTFSSRPAIPRTVTRCNPTIAWRDGAALGWLDVAIPRVSADPVRASDVQLGVAAAREPCRAIGALAYD